MTTGTTRSYYFDPLTQTYSTSQPNQPSVHVTLTSSKELATDQLKEVIQRLGNYIAVHSIKNVSQWTQKTYCTDYTKHASTCVQAPRHFCKRHLTPEEIEECRIMEEHLDPLCNKDWAPQMHGFPIAHGEVDLMRIILACVRSYIAITHKAIKT